MRALALLAGIAVAVLPVLWILLYVDRMAALPEVRTLEDLRVPIPERDGPPVVFGRGDLLQANLRDAAEPGHVAVLRDPAGDAAIANVARSRRVGLEYAGGSVLDLEHLLSDGDRFEIDRRRFEVAIDGDRLELTFPDDGACGGPVPPAALPALYGTEHRGLEGWESRSLSIGGGVCHEPDRLERFRTVRHLRRLVGAALGEDAPPILVAHPGLPEDAATVRWSESFGRFVLRAARDAEVRVCAPGAARCVELGRQPWPLVAPEPLGPLKRVTLGRTTYEVSVGADALVLTPIDRPHWVGISGRPDPGVAATAVRRGLSPDAAAADRDSLPLAAIRAIAEPVAGHGDATLLLVGASVAAMLALMAGAAAGSSGRLAFLLLGGWLWCVAAAPGIGTIVGRLGAPMALAVAVASAALIVVTLLRMPRALRRTGWARGALGTAPVSILALSLAAAGLFTVATRGAGAAPSEPDAALAAQVALAALAALCLARTAWVWLVDRSVGGLLVAYVAALVVIVGLGAVALAQLTYGQGYGQFLALYQRHVWSMATAFMGAAVVLCFDVAALRFAFERLVGAVQTGVRLPAWAVVAATALVAALVADALGYRAVPGTALPGPAVRLLSAVVVAAAAAVAAIVALSLGRVWRAVRREGGAALRIRDRVRLPGAALLIPPSLVLGVLVLVTGEAEGLAGGLLQPSELAKTWVTVLFALAAATLAVRGASPSRARVGTQIGSAAFVVGFFTVGSALNSDLSPIVILAAVVMTVGLGGAFIWIVAQTSLPERIAFGAVVLLAAWALLDWSGRVAVVLIALLAVLVPQDPSVVRTLNPSFAALTSSVYRGPPRRGFHERLREMRGVRLAGAVIGLLVVLAALVHLGSQLGVDRLARYEGTILGQQVPSVPQERLLAWQDARIGGGAGVLDHADLSLQVTRSREVVAATGCGLIRDLRDIAVRFGAVEPGAPWRGLPGLCPDEMTFPRAGPVHEALLRVPAIQDDFAATFFTATFGLDGVFVLMSAQLVMIGAMVAIAAGGGLALARSAGRREMAIFGVVALACLSVILACQFVAAWGNMLGLLPVVGQPMTFVSMAGSHHFGFAAPAVMLTVVVAMLTGEAGLAAGRPRPLIGPGSGTLFLTT